MNHTRIDQWLGKSIPECTAFAAKRDVIHGHGGWSWKQVQALGIGRWDGHVTNDANHKL